MGKDIPLKIEFFLDQEDDRCRINSAKEIESILHQIAKKGSRVALYYGNSNEFILTTLLSVDDSGLYLEQSANDQDNQRIVESNKLVFVGIHTQIKIQFFADLVNRAVHNGNPAFFLPLPTSIYRLQRREYYRLTIPANEPLHCSIVTNNAPENRPHKITVMDISGGGIGLFCAETDTVLSVGHTYTCQFDLPDTGTIKGAMVVRNLNLLTSPSGQTYTHAGCEFKNLDRQSTILLQRYVTNAQRKGKGNS